MKHTPGPWITFQPRGDGSVPVRTDGLGLTICYVHDGAICDAIANAHLIAAAPELADLCEMVARLNPVAGEIGAGMLANMVEKARNIMAQIEGRKESK